MRTIKSLLTIRYSWSRWRPLCRLNGSLHDGSCPPILTNRLNASVLMSKWDLIIWFFTLLGAIKKDFLECTLLKCYRCCERHSHKVPHKIASLADFLLRQARETFMHVHMHPLDA